MIFTAPYAKLSKVLFSHRSGSSIWLWPWPLRVKKEYDSLKEEFQVAEEVIKARCRAHMTQADLAKKSVQRPRLYPDLDLHYMVKSFHDNACKIPKILYSTDSMVREMK